jgi:N-acyl-D-amino-acid deacylase
MVAEMKATLKRHHRKDYSYAVIAEYKHDRKLNGLSIPEAAKAKRGSDSVTAQIEMILEIEEHGGAQGVFHGMDEEDLQRFMRHPNTMFASDSGIREFGEGVPHPRGYGNNARVLARYVRELGELRLEDAVRRMTTLPARTFHFKERGELVEGDWADVVVFDPATVQDHATYKDPHHYSTGFQYVLVNGVVVIKNGEHTGARPGMALRHAIPASAPLEKIKD